MESCDLPVSRLVFVILVEIVVFRLPRKADDSKAARAPHTPHADATADADAKRSLPPGAMTTDPWHLALNYLS